MKLYTRQGDGGETGLYTGERVPKNHPRLEVLGTLDELNSLLGVLRSQTEEVSFTPYQQTLFRLGAELACSSADAKNISRLSGQDVRELEASIDQTSAQLPPLTTLLFPCGPPAAAFCHLARTVCRRLERNLVTLHETEPVSPEILAWVNRFSDWLFMQARFLARDNIVTERNER